MYLTSADVKQHRKMKLSENLKDPKWVWQFQQYFGIEKLKLIERSSNTETWLPVEVSKQKKDDFDECKEQSESNLILYQVKLF